MALTVNKCRMQYAVSAQRILRHYVEKLQFIAASITQLLEVGNGQELSSKTVLPLGVATLPK